MSLSRPLHDERRGLETVWNGGPLLVPPEPRPAPPVDCSHLTNQACQRAARKAGRPGRAEILAHVRPAWEPAAVIAARAGLRIDTASRLLFSLWVHGRIEREARYWSTGREQSWYRRVG